MLALRGELLKARLLFAHGDFGHELTGLGAAQAFEQRSGQTAQSVRVRRAFELKHHGHQGRSAAALGLAGEFVQFRRRQAWWDSLSAARWCGWMGNVPGGDELGPLRNLRLQARAFGGNLRQHLRAFGLQFRDALAGGGAGGVIPMQLALAGKLHLILRQAELAFHLHQ